ncbi:hypothetical protein KIPE111705_02315 [Kibdelosporangium persicum]|uniref:DUF2188 domain-containing protein n=1 Tax=Kibdelosporangium persicum TaxID=2698649 RepID=A0ABX2F3U3_9PSEU|nr:hypothetical protein [Kibdelosporangium persicum]NRN66006.1 hypothetical protein [Kibdelosporangium persicum]
MMEPIEANYVPDGDGWTITIVGRGQTLTATAPGLVAARDQAEQLVNQIAGNDKNRTVVHRLDGDALEFTTAYLNARLAKPEEPAAAPVEKTEPAEPAKDDTEATKAGAADNSAGKPSGDDEPAQAAKGS